MKVDSLPAAIMLIWGLWKTLHMLLFGWDKGQFYPEKGMLGWHFLIQWLCSLLVLMLGETSKIVLPQGFNCSLPCSVRYAPWFIIIKLVHYHSLHSSSDQQLSPQERCSGSEELGNLEGVVSSQAAPLCSQQPTGVSGVVPSLYCHQNEWLSPHMAGTASTRKGSSAPLRSRKCDPCTLTCHLDKGRSWG